MIVVHNAHIAAIYIMDVRDRGADSVGSIMPLFTIIKEWRVRVNGVRIYYAM